MKISVGTIARTIALLLALVNQFLVACGINTIPIAEETVTELITMTFTVGTSVAAWWKNNSFTSAAIKGDQVMRKFKK